MYRSTKGASKARRDQINAEIRNLKELLPISDADKARLSYLHIMSLACMYTRKSVFFSQEMSVTTRHEASGSGSLLSSDELSELMNALPGFLLLISSEGKLLYLSDNVAEHLGHSMVDLVAQSDSVYDIIDPNDHFILRSNLVPTTTADTDRLFRCRFNTSKFIRRQGAGNKLTLVRARCLSLPASTSSYWSSNPVWMCSCSPLDPRVPYPVSPKSPLLTPPPEHSFFLACFHSRHARDMRLLEAQDSVSVYLGYDVETLRSRSWYSLLHPRDLTHASAKHCALLHESGQRRSEMVVQVEASGGSWVWLYMLLQLEMGDQPISCLNYVISESEAWSIRQQLCLEQNQLALYLGGAGAGAGAAGAGAGGALYPEPAGLLCPLEPLSSPDQVFTPSSGLSAQSFDFSLPTSGQSSSDELGGAGPLDPHPHHHQHQHQRQHQPAPQQPPSLPPPEGVARPGRWSGRTGSIQASLEPSSASCCVSSCVSSSAPLQRPPLPALPPLVAPAPPQKGEFVCTPPYTPRFGSFLFGEELFGSDSSCAAGASGTPLVGAGMRAPPQSAPPFGLAPPLPADAARYRKLPLECGLAVAGLEYTTMTALPEIRGPLFVDVPQGQYPAPPEGLLTPDASPTTHPSPPSRGGREREIERLEISLLAQYISAVAEGFYDNPLHPKATLPSDPHPAPTPPQGEEVSLCELYLANAWASVDLQPVPEEISLLEESIVVDVSPKNASPASSTSCCSPPAPPPAPETRTPSCPSQGAQSSIGVYHFSSVQSARCTLPVGGGLIGPSLGEEGGVFDVEMEGVEPAMLPSASQPSSIPACPPPAIPGASCAPYLLEDLVAMETVFGAGAPMPPALGQHPELYQLPLHSSPHGTFPDGTSEHTF